MVVTSTSKKDICMHGVMNRKLMAKEETKKYKIEVMGHVKLQMSSSDGQSSRKDSK